MIPSLPATFNGVRFRSRTEARWAVFMTELGVEWRYEHEGFALPSGNYLPDFWLPQLNCFLEIKGQKIQCDSLEYRLLEELAELSKCSVVLFVGTPQECVAKDHILDHRFYGEAQERCQKIFGINKADYPYLWTVCSKCSVVGIEFDGRSARVTHHPQCAVLGTGEDKRYNAGDSRIRRAVDVSRAWRSPEGG